MKVKASVKADPSKGDKLVRRRGRIYVINKKDPNRKQRQKGAGKIRKQGNMAKKSSIEREKKRKKMVSLKWEVRQELKKIIKDVNVAEEEKEQAKEKLNKLPKNSSYVRLRNRCVLTGRSRGYLRKFKLSRICFREFANKGLIPGMFKASW